MTAFKYLPAALLAFTPGAFAADHWIQPGQSIQAAIDAAANGDRILIHPGTYNEVLDLRAKDLSIVGLQGPEQTILDGAGYQDTILWAHGPSTASVEGLTLTNGRGHPFPSSYGQDWYGGAIFAHDGAQLSVVDCRLIHNGHVSGTFAGGAYAGGPSTAVSFSLCIIADNYAWASGGGTLVDHGGTMTFDRCTVYGNDSTSFFGYQGGVSMANAGTVALNDSIVWGNGGEQIAAFGSPYNQGTQATAAYCNVQGGFPGTGNISGSPAFADPAGGDFHLLPDSPCIDAGDPAAMPDPDGSRRDMGALPFGAAAPLGVLCYADPGSGGCPCGNTPLSPERGCRHSGGVGMRISAFGGASVSQDDLAIQVSYAPPVNAGMFIVGSDYAELPVSLFDGLTCVTGATLRFRGLFQLSGTVSDTGFVGQDPTGSYFVPGEAYYFQYWTRDVQTGTSPCGAFANLSPVVGVRMLP